VPPGALADRAAVALAEGGDDGVVECRVDPRVSLPVPTARSAGAGCHRPEYQRGSVEAIVRGCLPELPGEPELVGDDELVGELELDGESDGQVRTPHVPDGDGCGVLVWPGGVWLGDSLGVRLGLWLGDFVGEGTRVGDGGGVYGSCPVCGAVPSRFAGGGNASTARPSMSRFITSVQVWAG